MLKVEGLRSVNWNAPDPAAAERFYLEVCGMTAGDRDPDKQHLLWCEFTPEGAERFLTKGNP